MANGYKITRSNYTIKKPHTKLSDGTIYERDFMTTNNFGGWDSGSIPNTENGFKMVYRDRVNSVKSHNFGNFIVTPDGTTGWTSNNIALKNKEDVTSESKILLNTNKNTLLSYAYYGNCTELIKSTIRKIINNFPAEVFPTKELVNIGGVEYYILDNSFEIDFVTKKISYEEEQNINPLRYFYLSYQRYKIFEKEGGEWKDRRCVDKWEVRDIDGCLMIHNNIGIEEKEITISAAVENPFTFKFYRLTVDGKYIFITPKEQDGIENVLNVKISPAEIEKDKFYTNLDDFSKLLLNKDTYPKYTAKLDYPHETERGIETYVKSFTWPVSVFNDENIDISSNAYTEYVNSLLKLSSFYDENYTDNLWRMMTHDSIKNMDITFSRGNNDEDKEDYNYGTSKLEGLLWAYGRQFDEIKKYIDNIKFTNTITYNNNDNIPDYFLTDVLHLSGWEINSAVKNISGNASVGDLYDGIIKEYTSTDANTLFLKNLKLNSKSIFSRKGTRYGIETILGLFGYFSDDFKGKGKGNYSISEYTRIVETGKTVAVEDAEKYGFYRTTIDTDNGGNGLEGLPVNFFYYKEGEEIKEVLIPWFYEREQMDGRMYFQMYGGWNEETVNYIKIYPKINSLQTISFDDLYKKNGKNFVYVYDISDFEHYFGNQEPTHYFSFDGGNLSIIGDGGWIPAIGKTELANVIDNYNGNNPHVGYDSYDNGEEYFKYFEQILKGAIDNDALIEEAYTCDPERQVKSEILNLGWNISENIEDNKKCWFFYDKEVVDFTNERIDFKPLKYMPLEQKYIGQPMVYIGEGEEDERYTYYGTDITNSGNTSNTIYAEPSILNSKKININFRIASDTEQKFLKESVIPYLQQMVPSTAILEITYDIK